MQQRRINLVLVYFSQATNDGFYANKTQRILCKEYFARSFSWFVGHARQFFHKEILSVQPASKGMSGQQTESSFFKTLEFHLTRLSFYVCLLGLGGSIAVLVISRQLCKDKSNIEYYCETVDSCAAHVYERLLCSSHPCPRSEAYSSSSCGFAARWCGYVPSSDYFCACAAFPCPSGYTTYRCPPAQERCTSKASPILFIAGICGIVFFPVLYLTLFLRSVYMKKRDFVSVSNLDGNQTTIEMRGGDEVAKSQGRDYQQLPDNQNLAEIEVISHQEKI